MAEKLLIRNISTEEITGLYTSKILLNYEHSHDVYFDEHVVYDRNHIYYDHSRLLHSYISCECSYLQYFEQSDLSLNYFSIMPYIVRSI